MLAKRLVSELSASDEGESIMITKLKQMCGFEYTSKLQRMFTDANLSKEITDQFKAVCYLFLIKLNFTFVSRVKIPQIALTRL
jgi:hypothetical protein